MRSTGASAIDGAARLTKGRRARGEVTDQATSLAAVGSIELGLPDGSQGAKEGSILIDDFVLALP